MESILAAAFGRVVNIQEGEADQLTDAAASVFGGAQAGGNSLIVLIIDHFPFLVPLIRYYFSRYSERGRAVQILTDTAIELVKARRKESSTDRKVPYYTCIVYLVEL